MGRHGTFFIALAALCLAMTDAFAEQRQSPSLTTYGTPGLIEMPTAEVLNDGELALTASAFGPNFRYTAAFQILPRIYGSFRYSVVEDFGGQELGDRYDRSFDIHFQLSDETENRPAIALGLRDFLGTGIYSSEYLVATKSVGNYLRVTGGLGWGRLAGRGGFSNPLRIFGDRFETRPPRGSEESGQLSTSNWFRGDAALFGGLQWDVNERTSIFAEYSSDAYTEEQEKTDIDIGSWVNFGLEHRFKNGVRLKGYVIGKHEIGAQLSYVLDPSKRRVAGGREPAPLPVGPRGRLAATEWNDPSKGGGKDAAEAVLKSRLGEEGLVLKGFAMHPTRARIRVWNEGWDVEAQAAGRAARVMAETLPPDVEELIIVFEEQGTPISRVVTQRSDLEELQYDYDGSWRTRARAKIEDAYDEDRTTELPGAYPAFDYALVPYAAFSFFDPDQPIRGDFGAELQLAYRPIPGLTIGGRFRYPIVGNIGDADRPSDSVLPRVRTDAVRYAQESELEINTLTAEYVYRPAPDMFVRVTAGYLENMFGGVSTEVLWYPIDSRLALGGELNYARQRDFDMLLGFQDYDVVTGHASAYYDFGNRFFGQVDAGRYLAGDWGATFTLSREFNNGFRVGGFFTLTDVSSKDFGEGSFDKGIRIEVPVPWLTGKPTRDTFRQTIRPVLRDGGARLNVDNRLYRLVRDYRAIELSDGWGRYLR